MKEELLHYIWQFQLFNNNNLVSEEEPLRVIKQGELNHDSGPDFFNARIKIGETIWAGNIEIHVKTSDWYKHGHQHDKAYKNIILHVVYEHDLLQEKQVPVLELKELIPQNLLQHYNQLMGSTAWIPCSGQPDQVPEFTTITWLERLAIERLQQRHQRIMLLLNQNNGDWQETLYQLLAANFGFKTNAAAFEQLAKATPYHMILKNRFSQLTVEALLFGQAGLLTGRLKGEYPLALKKEYLFQQKKYNLKPIAAVQWKFMRMRPANFPTIRIAQFAALLLSTENLVSAILAIPHQKSLQKLFNVEAGDYWRMHYHFGKESEKKSAKKLGNASIQGILINTVIPFIFSYGQARGLPRLKERALQLLEQTTPEKNSILKKWQKEGISNQNALQSQALLQLYSHYCKPKKCLQCSIGNKLLRI